MRVVVLLYEGPRTAVASPLNGSTCCILFADLASICRGDCVTAILLFKVAESARTGDRNTAIPVSRAATILRLLRTWYLVRYLRPTRILVYQVPGIRVRVPSCSEKPIASPQRAAPGMCARGENTTRKRNDGFEAVFIVEGSGLVD